MRWIGRLKEVRMMKTLLKSVWSMAYLSGISGLCVPRELLAFFGVHMQGAWRGN